MSRNQALDGLRVVEFGQFVAAPSAGRILADFGAEVVKVEAPSGDPLRGWGADSGGSDSWWWRMQARGKRLVAIDHRTLEGRRVSFELARRCDVLIANLRPGRMESWGLGYAEVAAANPAIIYASISGFGASGPYRERPGFGNIAEAMGGIRYVTGFADRPPVRTGLSVGDELAALQAVIGILLALHRRDQDPEHPGEFVDVALNESVLSITEGLIPDYANAGIVQERTGNQLLRSAPSNIYPAADGRWVAISANSNKTFANLAKAMNQPELADDPRLQTNAGRVAAAGELDELISSWTAQHDHDSLLELLAGAGVPSGPVMSARDICEDPQIRARKMIRHTSTRSGDPVQMLDVIPRLANSPGAIRWAGGEVGEDTDAVLAEYLGYPTHEIKRLRDSGAIR